MSEELRQLIERAKGYSMSAAAREEQRRSFAFGNTHFENPLITREMVDQMADQNMALQPQGVDAKRP